MGNKPGWGINDSEKGTVMEEVAFYQEFSVLFRVSNREAVKDGMPLRN